MAFVAAGALLSLGLPELGERAQEALTLLTEMTLALILFHDAAQVRPRQITADRGLMVGSCWSGSRSRSRRAGSSAGSSSPGCRR